MIGFKLPQTRLCICILLEERPKVSDKASASLQSSICSRRSLTKSLVFQRVQHTLRRPIHDLQHLDLRLVPLNNLGTLLSFSGDLLNPALFLADVVQQDVQEVAVELAGFGGKLLSTSFQRLGSQGFGLNRSFPHLRSIMYQKNEKR